MRHFVFFLPLVALIVFTGCDPASLKYDTSTPQLISLHEYGIQSTASDIAEPPESLDELGHYYTEAARIVQGLTIQEADQALREAVLTAESGSVPQYLIEQAAAEAILRESILVTRDGLTQQELEALAHYTNVLVEHQFAGTVLVENALLLLDGHWNEEMIIAAIRSTLDAHEVYLTRLQTCANCDPARGFELLPPEIADGYLNAISEYRSAQEAAATRMRERLL